MTERILGIDVGAVSLSLVEVDAAGRILRSVSRAHEGEIMKVYAACRAALGADLPSRMVATGSTPPSIQAERRVDNLVAAVRAARALHPGLGALLLVGAERFSLSVFSPEGAYLESRFNSLCAAGTGSFLDQQARRLGLADSAELARTALRSQGERPRIATRCAVFAKTDLIHAQQEGYTVEAICDGLCRGLAANVHDALFSGQPVPEPVVFAGGVARNRAVAGHLADLLGLGLAVDEHASIYGAYGAALDWLARERDERMECRVAVPIQFADDGARPKTHFGPLELSLSRYPDFAGLRSYLYSPRAVEVPGPVEVDVYREAEPGQRIEAFLGLDVGSTSTKAILLGPADSPPVEGDEGVCALAGFYTRTAGRPLKAVQAIFEAAWDWAEQNQLDLAIAAAGTTGSGRKFIGALMRADLVLDEISAHARAAVELDPEVDTIIEIGGQDAKFTILSHGTVTQSIMNHVCAAGTGSFIEEQAQRLGCALGDMADRTAGRRAPLASDRCTVFMERDINHFLADGFSVDEVLCAVLHAVRDNYLLKVARAGNIGRRICFQGATAKNRSLVAAFEQKLGQAIQVSRYCHLTGALGVALTLRDQAAAQPIASTFRGLDLYTERIPVRGQVCDLCHNNCKLRLAEVRGEQVGFGYLCGRDPDEEKFVSANRSGFDLLRERAKHFRVERGEIRSEVVIGLPAALHLVEDLPLWRRFFAELGVRTVTSEKLADPVTRGKRLASAEFCAPVAAWHGHVAELAERADYVFAPFYLEYERPKDERRQYCYYTQYAPTLIDGMAVPGLSEKCLTPLVHIGERSLAPETQLYRALRGALGKDLKRAEVARAFERASAWFAERQAAWPGVMRAALSEQDDLAVVLLGRPYTVLSARMNKAVPDILAKLGIKAFYQDMLQIGDLGEAEGLVRRAKWIQTQRLLAAAEVVGRTEGLYPVLLTSFKCTPDACSLEFFRRVMSAHSKPYLILQLDEHDSQVGYETRIEAAVRAFANHRAGFRPPADRRRLPVAPVRSMELGGRSLLVPAWDSLASPLFVAGLRQVGVDAHLIEEDPELVQQSVGLNTGQCIPLTAIVHEYVAQVSRMGLDPGATALWMPNGNISCNLCYFPEYAKGLLETIGGGFEHSLVYAGEITAVDFSTRAVLNSFFAYLFGGMLRRLQCKVRPYEVHAGQADRATAEGVATFRRAILGELPKRQAAREVVERFLAIEVAGEARQQVAVFGDLYVRDNDVFNQDLLHTIEAHGGEVVTTPYTEYCSLIATPYLRKWLREGSYLDVLKVAPFAYGMDLLERPFRREFERVLGERPVVAPQGSRDELLARFRVSMYHYGESFENLLKIFHLVERYPNLSLFVQTNPAFCCPSLVTEAMAGRIEQATGIPVVTVTYDGTGSPKNDVVIPYLELGRGAGVRAPSNRARPGRAAR